MFDHVWCARKRRGAALPAAVQDALVTAEGRGEVEANMECGGKAVAATPLSCGPGDHHVDDTSKSSATFTSSVLIL